MATKVKATKEHVNKTEGQVPAEREEEALQALQEEDRAEEQRLLEEAKQAMAADARLGSEAREVFFTSHRASE